MSTESWVKEYRKITEWGWYKHLPTCHLFRHLIIKAQWKPSTFRGVTLDCGQLITGRKQLASETGLSEQQIKTALSNLQKTQEITIKSTNAFSIITVCNYNTYQGTDNDTSTSESANEQPAKAPTSNQRATNEQPAINHIQERKKERIEERKHSFAWSDCEAQLLQAGATAGVIAAMKERYTDRVEQLSVDAATSCIVALSDSMFAGVDVPLEIRKAAMWEDANPSRRKTAKGLHRFLIGWMHRQQNRATTSQTKQPAHGDFQWT